MAVGTLTGQELLVQYKAAAGNTAQEKFQKMVIGASVGTDQLKKQATGLAVVYANELLLELERGETPSKEKLSDLRLLHQELSGNDLGDAPDDRLYKGAKIKNWLEKVAYSPVVNPQTLADHLHNSLQDVSDSEKRVKVLQEISAKIGPDGTITGEDITHAFGGNEPKNLSDLLAAFDQATSENVAASESVDWKALHLDVVRTINKREAAALDKNPDVHTAAINHIVHQDNNAQIIEAIARSGVGDINDAHYAQRNQPRGGDEKNAIVNAVRNIKQRIEGDVHGFNQVALLALVNPAISGDITVDAIDSNWIAERVRAGNNSINAMRDINLVPVANRDAVVDQVNGLRDGLQELHGVTADELRAFAEAAGNADIDGAWLDAHAGGGIEVLAGAPNLDGVDAAGKAELVQRINVIRVNLQPIEGFTTNQLLELYNDSAAEVDADWIAERKGAINAPDIDTLADNDKTAVVDRVKELRRYMVNTHGFSATQLRQLAENAIAANVDTNAINVDWIASRADGAGEAIALMEDINRGNFVIEDIGRTPAEKAAIVRAVVNFKENNRVPLADIHGFTSNNIQDIGRNASVITAIDKAISDAKLKSSQTNKYLVDAVHTVAETVERGYNKRSDRLVLQYPEIADLGDQNRITDKVVAFEQALQRSGGNLSGNVNPQVGHGAGQVADQAAVFKAHELKEAVIALFERDQDQVAQKIIAQRTGLTVDDLATLRVLASEQNVRDDNGFGQPVHALGRSNVTFVNRGQGFVKGSSVAGADLNLQPLSRALDAVYKKPRENYAYTSTELEQPRELDKDSLRSAGVTVSEEPEFAAALKTASEAIDALQRLGGAISSVAQNQSPLEKDAYKKLEKALKDPQSKNILKAHVMEHDAGIVVDDDTFDYKPLRAPLGIAGRNRADTPFSAIALAAQGRNDQGAIVTPAPALASQLPKVKVAKELEGFLNSEKARPESSEVAVSAAGLYQGVHSFIKDHVRKIPFKPEHEVEAIKHILSGDALSSDVPYKNEIQGMRQQWQDIAAGKANFPGNKGKPLSPKGQKELEVVQGVYQRHAVEALEQQNLTVTVNQEQARAAYQDRAIELLYGYQDKEDNRLDKKEGAERKAAYYEKKGQKSTSDIFKKRAPQSILAAGAASILAMLAVAIVGVTIGFFAPPVGAAIVSFAPVFGFGGAVAGFGKVLHDTYKDVKHDKTSSGQEKHALEASLDERKNQRGLVRVEAVEQQLRDADTPEKAQLAMKKLEALMHSYQNLGYDPLKDLTTKNIKVVTVDNDGTQNVTEVNMASTFTRDSRSGADLLEAVGGLREATTNARTKMDDAVSSGILSNSVALKEAEEAVRATRGR